MKSLKIEPSALEGSIRIPPSKSISHRAVICAGLADGISTIENVIFSQDIKATIDGMSALGTVVHSIETGADGTSTIKIQGNPKLSVLRESINCFESGSTLRFLIPLASFSGKEITFYGEGKLVERPLHPYYQIFQEQGLDYSTNHGLLPLTLQGSLKPGNFNIKGDISSQFITGLMFLLPLLEGNSKIIVTTELESKGYVDLTTDVLGKFGIYIDNQEYKEFSIKGNQKYKYCNYRIEGDYSQAAFWIVAGILGERIECLDLNPDSLQGDRAILEIASEMGAILENSDQGVVVKRSRTKGTVIDAEQCPDLVPVLTVLAALSQGTTKIINAARLRIKESDRLKAITNELNKLGAKVSENEDSLIIEGVERLKGGTVDSWNDHRIAMALAVASIKCTEPVTITGFEAVRKSYPHFWDDFKKLGGKI